MFRARLETGLKLNCTLALPERVANVVEKRKALSMYCGIYEMKKY